MGKRNLSSLAGVEARSRVCQASSSVPALTGSLSVRKDRVIGYSNRKNDAARIYDREKCEEKKLYKGEN